MGVKSSKSCGSGSWFSLEEVHTDRLKFPVQRGDLIEVHRGIYKHWVICERVLDRVDWQTIWCFHVGVIGEGDTPHWVILYEPLTDILVNSGHKTPSLCRINNQKTTAKYWIAKVGALYRKPNLDKVFEDLHRHKNERVRYNLKTMNCEHYVTLWKYGTSWSYQINSFILRLCSKQLSISSSKSKEHQL